MIISRNWLIKYIPKLISKTDDEIAMAFNFLGFEVEQVQNYDQNSNVVCGKILEHEIIKDTHLNLCQVLIGNQKIVQIICGANNVTKDAIVLVALPGAKLANNKEIFATSIKGHSSEGMLCGWDELGINSNTLTPKETGGIALLPTKEFEKLIGSSQILQMLGLTDTSYILDLTINRSDCWGAYQLALEIANYFHYPIIPLSVMPTIINTGKMKNVVTIESNNVISAVFSVCQINNENYQQPTAEILWLKRNELAVDNNNLNNYALITELVTSQPIYLFDYEKINSLVIKEYVINGVKKLGFYQKNEFLGIIGQDLNSKYCPDQNSRQILILSLNVNYSFMRKQLQSEQQTNHFYQRFAKPMALAGLELGMFNLLALLKERKILTEVLSFTRWGEKPVLSKPITLLISEINQNIGCQFTVEKVQKLLEPLNFQIKILDNEKQKMQIIGPIMRTDIVQKADIFEEVARLYGYNNIPIIAPKIISQKKSSSLIEKIINIFENACYGWNINQVKTYALTTPEEISEFNFFNYKSNYHLKMPMSQEHSVMRVSLLHQLIAIAQYNNSRNITGNFFTVEKIYFNDLQDNYHGALLMQEDNLSFSSVKGKIDSFLSHLGLDLAQVVYQPTDKWHVAHPFQSAEIIYHKNLLGVIGKLHPMYSKKNNVVDSYFCEVNLTKLTKILTNFKTQITNVSKFMPITRDLSLFVAKDCSYQTIYNIINRNIPYLINCQLKDYYIGEKIPNNYKAFTFTLEFNDIKEQLTDESIKTSYEQILSYLQASNLDIIIR